MPRSRSEKRRATKRQSSSARFDSDEKRARVLRDEGIVLTDEHPEADLRHMVRPFVRVGLTLPPPKVSISLRIDADVLEWLKAQGEGYQTRMTAVLRAFRDESL
jgi:uncharacterized protein (DUF4415 family)